MLMYVIRHGETDYNKEGRMQGSQDIPLNSTGLEQANANGLRLADHLGSELAAFDFVSSPLGRTRQTMEIIRLAAGLEPDAYRVDCDLIEICFGDWEGFTMRQLRNISPEDVEARDRDKWRYRPPGKRAESYEMITDRVERFLGKVDRPTVCVAHGGIMRAMFNLIAQMEGKEAAMLDIYQDRVLKIEGSQIDWLS